MIGKLHGIIRDMVTGQCLVTFAVNDSARVVEQSAELRDKELNIKATKYHKPRSLDANAYHWVLCHKIAHALQTDAKSIHYELMLRYGTPLENPDGSKAVISVLKVVDPRRAGVYARKIGSGSVEGKEFDHYLLIKRSREYDSKEMAHLLDGTIDDAQALGIETLPPERLKRMMEALEEHERRTQKKHENKSM